MHSSESSSTDHISLGVTGRLRAYFFAGVLVTAPLSITVYIAWQFVRWVDGWVSPLIPPNLNPQAWEIPGFGLVAVLAVLTLIGALTAGFAGRLFLRMSEAVLSRMPVLYGIYGAVKQVLETMLTSKTDAFREVCLVEYPREGSWTIGFIAGATTGEARAQFDQDMINVFVPTTPNPTSGFLLIVPRTHVKVLTMPVEDGFKMLISMGIITPPVIEAKSAE